MSTGTADQILEVIPEPEAIRAKLGQNVREKRYLRQLLRLSERMAAERRRKAGDSSQNDAERETVHA